MTRLFTEGFELDDVLAFPTTSATCAASTTQARSGPYSCNLAGGGFGQLTLAAGVSEAYFRMGYWTSGTGTHFPLSWWTGTTSMGRIRINTAFHLEFWTILAGVETLVATGSLTVPQNTWFLLEVHVKISDTVGAIDAKIDGITDTGLAFAGDTKPSTDTTFNIIRYGGTNAGNQQYIDDLAINDTGNGDGLNDNSWCGDGRIYGVMPSAAGDHTGLTASTGANWTDVDEIPPNTTDFVSSNTPGAYDLYSHLALSPALPAGATILRVWPECRALESTAGGDNIQLGIKPSGGSESWCANIPVTTAYARYVGTNYKQNPLGPAAWTETTLNSTQVGFKVI